jgi:hypothetical protein
MFGTQVMVKEMSNVVLLRAKKKSAVVALLLMKLVYRTPNFRNFYSPSYVMT